MRCERESTKPIASPPPIRKNLWQWKPKIAAIQELKKPNWTVDSGVAHSSPLLQQGLAVKNSLDIVVRTFFQGMVAKLRNQVSLSSFSQHPFRNPER